MVCLLLGSIYYLGMTVTSQEPDKQFFIHFMRPSRATTDAAVAVFDALRRVIQVHSVEWRGRWWYVVSK